jgi:exopolyphosphatase/guanosine-5'-triphosphate,3'-diphosphate pyrophosphatase
VVYEALTRSITPVFNEKILCGLGREVQSTGLLAEDAIARALSSLRRFRALCRVMHVGKTFVVATAACRFHRARRAGARADDRDPVGQARG